MAASTYRRVSNDDEYNNSNSQRATPFRRTADSSNLQQKSSPGSISSGKTKAERISDKIHALLWVGLAVIVGWYTSFFQKLLNDPRVHRPLFNLALVCIGINCVLVLYLTVYLPKFKNIHSSAAWEIYCPRVIPTMTVVGLVCMVLFIRSTWEVWGFFAPLILGIESMGALFLLHFVPWC